MRGQRDKKYDALTFLENCAKHDGQGECRS